MCSRRVLAHSATILNNFLSVFSGFVVCTDYCLPEEQVAAINRQAKNMKKLFYTSVLVSLLLGGSVRAQFTSSVVYDGTTQEYLHRLDLFENYGNKKKLIDSKNQLVKFQHEHEDGTRTHRIFKLEIVGSSEEVVEFHVTYQGQEPAAEDVNSVQIDFDKAVISFLGFPLPKDHPLAGNWGRRYTFTFDDYETDEDNREVMIENSSPVRFSVDDKTGELKRIDVMTVYKTPEGFVGKIKAIEPEQPVNMKTMRIEEQRELAEQLLEKHAIPTPPIENLPTESHNDS